MGYDFYIIENQSIIRIHLLTCPLKMKILFQGNKKKKKKKMKSDTSQQLMKIWCWNRWCNVPIINNSKFRHRGFPMFHFLFAQKHFSSIIIIHQDRNQNRTGQNRSKPRCWLVFAQLETNINGPALSSCGAHFPNPEN